jgi:hypothetical protein
VSESSGIVRSTNSCQNRQVAKRAIHFDNVLQVQLYEAKPNPPFQEW